MQQPKLNFLVNHLGSTQMAFQLIASVNRITNGDQWASITIFYDQLQRDCRPVHVPCMNLMEAWRQDGISIATSLTTVSALLEMPGPQTKMFYVWDMAWMRNPKLADAYQELFRNPQLTLIARCADHSRVLTNNFNVEVPYVFDAFDEKWLQTVVKNEQSRCS